MEAKLDRLRAILRGMGSALVAFSGGCDSAFLLKVARDELGDRACALTAVSPTYPRGELEEARMLAALIGARHLIVSSNELGIDGFARNTEKRCYHCKAELFAICREKAAEMDLAHVADASNLDDLKDYRPGMEAAREMGVRSPLLEAGFTKQDIREASRMLGLQTWNKPALACLASRIPYDTQITRKRLQRIARCEEFLKEIGFRVFRVRYHGEVARIEVGRDELHRMLDPCLRESISRRFKETGFHYAALDLEGYRTGSMNEPLFRVAVGYHPDDLED